MTDKPISAPPTIVPLLEKSYLAVIRNSIGSNQFKNFYALVDNQEQDILRNGELSCAFFVSTILKSFSLINETHTTVTGLIKDLVKSGWQKVSEPTPGCILVWNPVTYPDGETHSHIGFYIGDIQAVSNSTSTNTPTVHHSTFDNSRTITAVYQPPEFPKIPKTSV